MEVDRLWGLAPDERVLIAPSGPTVRVRIEPGPHELHELSAQQPIDVPGLRAVRGEPLVVGRLASGEAVTLAARTADGVALAFDPDAAIRELIGRGALTRSAPATARLPVSYRLA